MKIKIFKYKKIILSILLIQFFVSNLSAEIIKEFNISGNDRVSDETIIMFSNLNIGDKINNSILNESLKELYKTNYFEDVSIKINEGIIFIELKENPIIQSIEIVGVKDNRIRKNLKEITSKLEKYPFVEGKISDQISLLKNILKSYGY